MCILYQYIPLSIAKLLFLTTRGILTLCRSQHTNVLTGGIQRRARARAREMNIYILL